MTEPRGVITFFGIRVGPTVVVPMHTRDLAKGTLNEIIKGSGLSREELLKRL